MTAAQLATILKGLSYSVEEVAEPNSLEDGMIKINDTLHIQVGFDYNILVEAVGDGSFRFGKTWSHRQNTGLIMELNRKLYPGREPSLSAIPSPSERR